MLEAKMVMLAAMAGAGAAAEANQVCEAPVDSDIAQVVYGYEEQAERACGILGLRCCTTDVALQQTETLHGSVQVAQEQHGDVEGHPLEG